MAEPLLVAPPEPVGSPPSGDGPVRGYDAIAGLVPFGLERDKPRHYRALAAALWESRDALPYALRVLRHGVCDGCGLGPRGLVDDVVDGPHLCNLRLERLRADTLPTLAPVDLLDIKRLRALDDPALLALGRLAHPYVYRRGERGFTRISWDLAQDLLTERAGALPPERAAFLAGGSRLTNEAAFTFGKAARLFGCAHLDAAGRAEHAAGLDALAGALGKAASTASFSDLVGADLVLLAGTDLAAEQPVLMKYLAAAKERGTRVVVVGPRLLEGQLSYWDAAEPVSAMFGASVMDDFIQVRPGGEAALLAGALKVVVSRGEHAQRFLELSTTGWQDLERWLDGLSWPELEAASGADARDMAWLGELFGRAKTAVTCVGGGLVAQGGAGVQAVVNLHLARGQIGAPKAGILALVGHAGSPGALDCGLAPDRLPGPAPMDEAGLSRLSARWGRPVTAGPGLDLPGVARAAARGEIDLLYTMGGDRLPVGSLAEGLARVAVHVHQESVLTRAALLEPGGLTLLLPSRTRHEQPGGGTTTSYERRVRLSPALAEPPDLGERRPDWEIPGRVVGALRPGLAGALQYPDGAAVRAELAEIVPKYAGIESLTGEAQWVQWGGPQLYADGVFSALPEGRARLAPVPIEPP